MDTPQKIVDDAAARCLEAFRTQFETGLALVNALVGAGTPPVAAKKSGKAAPARH